MSNGSDNFLWRDLVDAGLDVKEARLYLALLQEGGLPVSSAAERAFVSRTNAYDIVKRLVRRGLVQVVEDVGDHRTVLQANDPGVLLQQLAIQRERVEAMLPRLRAVRPKGSLPRVRYLEGAAGIRSALFESLSWPSPLYGILSMSDLMAIPGASAMAEYIQGRRDRGLQLHAVRSAEKESTLQWPTTEADLRVVRLAPEPYVFSMTTLIGEHTVATLSSRQENFAMIIESQEYAEQQRYLFEVLWDSSDPV